MTDNAFDIDELRATDTDELVILDPRTGEPISPKWVWTLAGPGHPVTVEQSNRMAKESLRLARLREQASANRKKWKEPERTPDEMREENARSFAGRVLGWTPIKLKGEPFVFSMENAVKLLIDPNYGWIYTQLIQYFNSDESFLRKSETTS